MVNFNKINPKFRSSGTRPGPQIYDQLFPRQETVFSRCAELLTARLHPIFFGQSRAELRSCVAELWNSAFTRPGHKKTLCPILNSKSKLFALGAETIENKNSFASIKIFDLRQSHLSGKSGKMNYKFISWSNWVKLFFIAILMLFFIKEMLYGEKFKKRETKNYINKSINNFELSQIRDPFAIGRAEKLPKGNNQISVLCSPNENICLGGIVITESGEKFTILKVTGYKKTFLLKEGQTFFVRYISKNENKKEKTHLNYQGAYFVVKKINLDKVVIYPKNMPGRIIIIN